MNNKNKVKSTRIYMRRRFIKVILATFGFVLIPFFIIAVLEAGYRKNNIPGPGAAERLKDSYNDIDVSDYVEAGGSAMVVDEDLNVINLGGPAICDKSSFDMEEWTAFLHDTGKASKNKYDVAYHDGEHGYWLVLSKPQAVTFSLSILINPKAPNFGANIGVFLGAFSVYFIILAVFILVYSKNAAKKITKSIEDISENAKDLERGEYDIEVSEGETLELDMLCNSMRHLGEELKEKSTIQKKEEEKRMLLISEISHDLKNPLAGVQGYSEMLLNGNVEESKKQDYLKMIYDNSVRSNNILQSLFTYSKLGSAGYETSLEPTDVSEYTRQIIAEYIPKLEEAGFKYSFSIPEEEIYIPMNRDLFRRIYDNLIENSVKYNVKGTEIRIEIRTSENIENIAETEKAYNANIIDNTQKTDRSCNGKLYIYFCDDGIGIPEEHIDSIFMPFYRVEGKTGRAGSGGSGLGLAIVEKIVRLHGGTITYVPNEKGCKFSMEFSLN